jgi:putative holliday junction resolvase
MSSDTTTIKKRILAIDYGTKRIGLAKTDPFQLFAQAVGTFDEPALLKEITRILSDDGIEKILLGYPLSGNGTANAMTKVVEQFEVRLQKKIPDVPIVRVDEFGSSKAAMKILIESGTRKEERNTKGRLDKAAAALLLQNYLDTRVRTES